MSNLRRYRKAAGMSQIQLADQAGVSRQLIGSVETGRHLPRVDAALALAAALGVTADQLFAAERAPRDVLSGEIPPDGTLVRAGRVGDTAVTAPLHRGTEGWGTVDGVVEEGSLTRFGHLDDGLVVAGCEPGLEVLERLLRQAGASAMSVMASSAAALDALANGRVHAAVVHGPALRRAKSTKGVARIRLASWQVGLADSCDAPADWFEQAISGRIPVVQREAGAGVQQAFEEAVGSQSVVPGPRASGHLEAAARAAFSGTPAVTIEPAALATGAQFRSLTTHETQLWIAKEWLDGRVVAQALNQLADQRFLMRLRAVGGYDLTDFGARLS